MNGFLVTPSQVLDGLRWAETLSLGYCDRTDKRRIFDSDVFSVACEQLVKAARNHSAEKGEFRHFALRCMRNGIIDYLRRLNRRRRIKIRTLMADEPSFARQENERKNHEEIIAAIMSPLVVESERDEVDREMMLDLYLRGKTVVELMSQYHISKQTVYNRIERIMGKIRRTLTYE